MQRLINPLVCAFLLFVSTLVSAEQKQSYGNYDVHYSVVNTTFLTPEVAKVYGIVRGDNKFILNISVREKQAEGGSVASKATLSGTKFDLIHREPLTFREIDEQTAVYYIAEFQAHDEEKLDFTVSVQPENSERGYKLQFNKTLYTGK